jgi:hypothetical protein
MQTSAHSTRVPLDGQPALPAQYAGDAGAHHFDDVFLSHCVQEGIELGLFAGDFDDVSSGGHVEDVAPEDFGQALDFFAPAIDRTRFHHHQFALDVGGLGNVDELHHVNQFVQLLGDLFDDLIVARGDQGHAGQRRVLGRGHGQRFDVVAAGGEQPGHAGERAGFVFNQDGDDMAHRFRQAPFRC